MTVNTIASNEEVELHLLALGIRPLTADGRDASVRVTAYDSTLPRPAGAAQLEHHTWGGWSLRYQPALRPRRSPTIQLWLTSARGQLLTRRLEVVLAAEDPMLTAEAAVRAELDAIAALDPAEQSVRRERLSRLRSISVTMFLPPSATLMAGASAFVGLGPPWARLIARASEHGQVIGLGQCNADGEFVLPVITAAPYRSQSLVWVDVFGPTAPTVDVRQPPLERVVLELPSDPLQLPRDNEEMLRGPVPGGEFTWAAGAPHPLVVGSPRDTTPLLLTT